MGWLEFVSSLVWPALVVGIIVAFRKPIMGWFEQPPTRVKAGSFEIDWDKSVSNTVEELETVDSPVASDGQTLPPSPKGSLAQRLHKVARVSPHGAIMDAAGFVEEELEGLARTVPDQSIRRHGGWLEYLRIIEAADLVSPPIWESLHSLRQLRNLAAHNRAQIRTSEALEFIALADMVIGVLSPIRQQRELNAIQRNDENTN